MNKTQITLEPLKEEDREQFIKDNQKAFKYGATEEFGVRDEHFEEDGEIISRQTIEQSIDNGEAYRIMWEGKPAGGVIVHVERERGDLEILFVDPDVHSKGIGYAAWCQIERMYPDVKVWETLTPYFETRNIHFYVNRCGFHIVEFFNEHHRGPAEADNEEDSEQSLEGMFRFEKRMR
ncbi:MAG: GNAT family N-acetyltransferase [Erysipelotrichaceae bacterium]|nr:GNAT family N-acetyltransferase [Erysipelotrichaceae bacterium]